MRVHPDARGFGSAAHAYDRGRPGYPDEAVDWLARKLRITAGTEVLDLAAGTGKLTRGLVARGARVVAVEPSAGMRERLREALPGVDVRDGVAEAIPLGAARVDAVVVAQAFHWFDADAALAEIHRVLRGGGLGLIWNTRDERDDLQRAVTALIEPLRSGTPRWREVDVPALIEHTPLFSGLEKVEVAYAQELDVDGFLDRFLSVSFVASAPADVRAAVEAELRELAGEPPIRLPYVTEAFVCFRR